MYTRPVRCWLFVIAATLTGCGAPPLVTYSHATNQDQPSYISGFDWEHPRERRRLPRELKEVSGLAPFAGGTVLAHDDNVNTIWLVDTHSNAPPRRYLHSKPERRGDYEDLTLSDGFVYLVDSHGSLLRAPLPPDSGPDSPIATPPVEFAAIDLAVEDRCVFEGLAARVSLGDFVLACKYLNYPAEPDIHLYKVSLDQPVAAPEPWVIDVAAIRQALDVPRLRPSALHWLEKEQRLLLLAGKERVLLEIDAQGRVLAWQRLRWGLHRQAEGLTVDAAGNIVIGDEANGMFATLTTYGRSR